MKTGVYCGQRRIRLALPLLVGIVGALFFVPSALVKPQPAAAYDVGPPVGKVPVHETMANAALDLYGVQFFNNVEDGIRDEDGDDHVYGLNLSLPVFGKPLVTASHFWVADADTDAPTRNAEALKIVAPLIPEPFRTLFLASDLTFENAWQKANALWSLALGAYADGNKPQAYHYFGHVVHLLGDLTVPAHAHDDPHGPTWFDDDSYHVWMDAPGDPPEKAKVSAADLPFLSKGAITPPDDYPNKLFWLFYTTQQVADFFASDDVDGNANDPRRLGAQDDVFAAIVNDPALSSLQDRDHLADNDGCLFPRSPICGSANDNDGDLSTIRRYTYLRGIRAIAGLYQLFEQTVSKQVTLAVKIDRVVQDEWHDYFPYPCPIELGKKLCVETSDADFYARVTIGDRESQNRGERVENDDDIATKWVFGDSVGTSGTVPVRVEIRDEDGAYWDAFSTGGADDDSDVDGVPDGNGREDLDLELNVDLAKCLRREPGAIGGDLTGTCGATLSQAGDSSLEASLVFFRIEMSKSPPTAEAGGPYTTNEGTNATLDGSGSTDPDNDIATYAWDFDDDGACDDATGAKPDFTAVGQDGPPVTVKLCVTDAVGLTDEDTATVTVNNVAPTIMASANTPKSENTSVTVSGTVSDPGWLDTLSGTISWGDGSPVEALGGTLENARPDATLTFGNSHTYGDNGTWIVQVCAADDDTNPCTSFSVSIDNTAPTATIDLSGAVNVNGTPTVIAHAGQAVAFNGRSTDPGSDDLTLTWTWGDGTAGSSTMWPVNPPGFDPPLSPSIQPRDVPSSVSHTFAGACAYETTFRAEDDDGGAASQTAAVIIVGNGHPNQGAGYWKQQFRYYNSGKGPSSFDAPRLRCYLRIVGSMSRVFDERNDASTFPRGEDILDTSQTSAILELFDQQLLAAWLNFANGAMEWNRLVDTNGDKRPDTRFLDAITAAETLRLNPYATRAQLDQQKALLQSWTTLP